MYTSEVEVLGLTIPLTERVTVEEREELEVLAARAATEGYADSRVKYEAARILSKTRLNRSLPAWRSEPFEAYRHYFDDYAAFDDAVIKLLEPFSTEVSAKKEKRQAARQAAALEAAGNVKALRAITQAAEATLKPFYEALAKLEAGGESAN